MSFNFGTPKTASGFTLPTAHTPTATSASTGGAGDTRQQIKPLTNLFGTPTGGTPAFSLGASPKTAAPSLSFGLSTTSSTATTPSFSITPAAQTTAPQFSLGVSSAASTTAAASSFTPIFGTGTSVASASGATAATPAKLSAALTPATTAPTTAPSLSLGGSAATTQASAVTTTATAAIPTSTTVSYAQLEDSINKWTIDLEEQGKFFINQAKQLNAWDNLLVSNSDKIVHLNETIERIKHQQKQLDQELDFVLAQQNELDELSAPLARKLAEIPVTDRDRFQTYQLSEIIDSQLKQMSEDLKEVVEHLNESNKDEDISDPVIQISKILNAHMNSLQWVDKNTTQISAHLEHVSQLHEAYKKNNFNV